nr:hypothetical protein [Tanacetum cinerariifolium]
MKINCSHRSCHDYGTGRAVATAESSNKLIPLTRIPITDGKKESPLGALDYSEARRRNAMVNVATVEKRGGGRSPLCRRNDEDVKECKPKAKIVEIFQKGDSFIREQTGNMYKNVKKKIERGVAFPTCLFVNNTICHFSPLASKDFGRRIVEGSIEGSVGHIQGVRTVIIRPSGAISSCGLELKDLTSLSLDELIGNLKVHEMIIKKDFEIVKAKVERKSLALKAKKESSYEECSTSRNKNQRAFVGGSWSDSSEEDDEKVNNETCLVTQASTLIETFESGQIGADRTKDSFWGQIMDDFNNGTTQGYRTTHMLNSDCQKFKAIYKHLERKSKKNEAAHIESAKVTFAAEQLKWRKFMLEHAGVSASGSIFEELKRKLQAGTSVYEAKKQKEMAIMEFKEMKFLTIDPYTLSEPKAIII